MNRCTSFIAAFSPLTPLSRRTRQARFGLLMAALSLLACTAAAQAREFPKTALRGVLEVTAPPQVLLDGLVDRLSPGARIRSPVGGFVMSGTLVGQRVVVNYARESNGLIHEVWLLTEAEAEVKRPGARPERNFVFESDAARVPFDDGKTPFDQLPKYKP